MFTISLSEFRQNIKSILDRIMENHEELIITRHKNKSMVVMSLDDYNSIKETAYLLSSKTNAKHIMDSLNALDSGDSEEKELLKD